MFQTWYLLLMKKKSWYEQYSYQVKIEKFGS